MELGHRFIEFPDITIRPFRNKKQTNMLIIDLIDFYLKIILQMVSRELLAG